MTERSKSYVLYMQIDDQPYIVPAMLPSIACVSL
jgi:hypothetical protein